MAGALGRVLHRVSINNRNAELVTEPGENLVFRSAELS